MKKIGQKIARMTHENKLLSLTLSLFVSSQSLSIFFSLSISSLFIIVSLYLSSSFLIFLIHISQYVLFFYVFTTIKYESLSPLCVYFTRLYMSLSLFIFVFALH